MVRRHPPLLKFIQKGVNVLLTQEAKRLGVHPSCKKKTEFDTTNSNEHTVVADLEDLKMGELRKLARSKGIKLPFGVTKDEVISRLKGE